MPKRTFNAKLLDGTVELYYDNEALYTFEEIHGLPAIDVIGSGQMGARAVTHFVYAGILHDQRQHIDQVKRRIPTRFKDLENLVKTIVSAVEDAYDVKDNSAGESSKNEKADQKE